MSKDEKASYLGIMRRRYAAVRTKKGRGNVLDEFCGMTGRSRKHAIKALSPKRRVPGRRGCPPGGTREGTALLTRLWKLSDMMCGKLLRLACLNCWRAWGGAKRWPGRLSGRSWG